MLVAEEDDAAAGVAGCRAEWLDGLYVLPQFWSRGVGRALHDDGARRGCERTAASAVTSGCSSTTTAPRRFYERLGWVENGTSRVVPFPPNPIDVGYSITL